MNFNNSFNDVDRFNKFDNHLSGTDDRQRPLNDSFYLDQQWRRDRDRDYGLMHIAPKPMM